MSKNTLAVMFGNRSFFPDHLVTEARKDIQALFREMGIDAVMVSEADTHLGGLTTYADAKICAELFKKHAAEIDGILIVLPNFGEEKVLADTVKLSGLRVPILVQAYPDDLNAFNVELRRDAFCGKISLCSNLRQYDYPYTVTELHTSRPSSESFRSDLENFLGVCRVVKGLRNARLGAVGARPNCFNTVRYSEKILQAAGITVVTADLSEILGAANRLKEDDGAVKSKLEGIRAYLPTGGVPDPSLARMARFSVALDAWMAEQEVQATALQCWDSLQANYGINVCTLMSMMSEVFMPSACEVDVTGVVSMFALQLATGKPSALVDWNNNYDDDPDKCVLFHCGNWAKSFTPEAKMEYANILATTLGKDRTYGAINGRVPAGPMSYARVTTDDPYGMIRAYVGEGRFTDDPLATFGSRAVVEVEDLQSLLRYIVKNGFEHHVAMNAAPSAEILEEAFTTYFGWDVYNHSAGGCGCGGNHCDCK